MSSLVILAILTLVWYVVWFITPRHKRGIVWVIGSIIFIGAFLTLTWTRYNA
jgi:hypothetical protein